MSRLIDITGNNYHRLRVIGFSHFGKGRKGYWVCECTCGNIVTLRKDHFAYPYSKQKSCGCLHRESSSKRMYEYHRKLRESKGSGVMRCKGYCGVTCVDGGCPMALRDEYEERGYDITHSCDECAYYKGCEDCAFEGTEYCEKAGGKEKNEDT